MSYNQHAESFSRAAATPYPIPGFDVPRGWSSFDQVYSDIADHAAVGVEFSASHLVGHLPTIARFAPKTQREIIAVVVRDMCALTDGDGLVRVRGGVYQWVIRHAHS